MGCLDRGGGHFIESPAAGDGRFYSIVWSTDHSLDGQEMGSKDVALLFDTLINWNLIRLSEGIFFSYFDGKLFSQASMVSIGGVEQSLLTMEFLHRGNFTTLWAPVFLIRMGWGGQPMAGES